MATSASTSESLNALANQVANLLVSRDARPGDKVALVPQPAALPRIYYGILKTGAVVVPLNVLLKGREVAYHLEDSDAKAYVCFEGTPSSDGFEGWAGFNQAECETFFLVTATPGADSAIDGAETLGAALADQPFDVRDRRDRGDGHRGDSLHQRHDRSAEGRRAVAFQPAAQRPHLQSGSSASPTRRCT